MNDFRSFEQLRVNELSVIRHGFFRPWFELSDGQFSYGKLSSISIWRNTVAIETAQENWVIKRKSLISRVFFIQQPQGVNIGTVTPEILSRKTVLNMDNGFAAALNAKAFLSRTYSWANDQHGELLTIKPAIWSYKTPFTISIDLNLLKNAPYLPLLALLGVNLILLKQAAQAATAH